MYNWLERSFFWKICTITVLAIHVFFSFVSNLVIGSISKLDGMVDDASMPFSLSFFLLIGSTDKLDQMDYVDDTSLS